MKTKQIKQMLKENGYKPNKSGLFHYLEDNQNMAKFREYIIKKFSINKEHQGVLSFQSVLKYFFLKLTYKEIFAVLNNDLTEVKK